MLRLRGDYCCLILNNSENKYFLRWRWSLTHPPLPVIIRSNRLSPWITASRTPMERLAERLSNSPKREAIYET